MVGRSVLLIVPFILCGLYGCKSEDSAANEEYQEKTTDVDSDQVYNIFPGEIANEQAVGMKRVYAHAKSSTVPDGGSNQINVGAAGKLPSRRASMPDAAPKLELTSGSVEFSGPTSPIVVSVSPTLKVLPKAKNPNDDDDESEEYFSANTGEPVKFSGPPSPIVISGVSSAPKAAVKKEKSFFGKLFAGPFDEDDDMDDD